VAIKKSSEAVPAVEAMEVVPAVENVGLKAITASGTIAEKTADAVVGASVTGFPKTHPEVKVNMEKMMKTAEEMVSFSQGNLEAFAKSSQIWAAGVQDLGKSVAATAQAQMEQTVATMKALAGVKSLKEAIDLQSNLARASVEKVMAETGKITDASLKLAEQTMAPITARVTLAMEKFGRAV
jgi:phasin family protein